MGWIRIADGMDDDPKVHVLATALGCPVAGAVGHLVLLLSRFPEHAPQGNLAQIPASLVERWAAWEGERGVFDAAFRETFLNADGIWTAWEKHNGAALREAHASRERAAEYRRRRADDLLNATVDSTPNGTANGSPHGKVLRTNVRTNITTGGRKRPFTGEQQNGHSPGHLPAQPLAPPFCPECGDGVAVQPEGSKRFVQVHAGSCSRRVE